MILREDGIRIISVNIEDSALEELLNDSSALKYLSETRMHTEKMPAVVMFAIKKENQLIGEVSLRNIKWYNRKAELSIFIADKYQGKGYGKTALLAVIKYAFETMNFYRLEAEVVDYNDRARKMIEKMGFIPEGRLREAKYYDGKYYDILRYGFLKTEYNEKYK
ncbi:MAG: GNAT family N-acetyltransferase [Calditrichaceae bacterium]